MKTDGSAPWFLGAAGIVLATLSSGCTLSSGIDLPNTDRGNTGSASDGAESPGVGAGDDDGDAGSGGDCGDGGAGGASDDGSGKACD